MALDIHKCTMHGDMYELVNVGQQEHLPIRNNGEISLEIH